jgi:hypothetical protein
MIVDCVSRLSKVLSMVAKKHVKELVESHESYRDKVNRIRKTCFTDVTLMKTLWFGEQDISQKRFKKFLKHAGHPTRNGTACKMWKITVTMLWTFLIEHIFRIQNAKEMLDNGILKIMKVFD